MCHLRSRGRKEVAIGLGPGDGMGRQQESPLQQRFSTARPMYSATWLIIFLFGYKWVPLVLLLHSHLNVKVILLKMASDDDSNQNHIDATLLF